MKQLLLLPVFAIILSFSQVEAQSPITLNASNVPLPIGGAIQNNLTTATVAPAMPGTNITWNYGSVTLATPYPYTYAPSTNANFISSSVHDTLNGDPLVTGYSILYNQYVEKTPNGMQIDGFEFPEQSYSVAPVSGNPTDSIWVPDQSIVYPQPLVYLPFPATMGTTWTMPDLHRTLKMKLTLTSYGINKTEFDKKSTLSRTNSVVGWGTLVLPSQSGTQSVAALMVKREDVRVDSFMLGGQPAPATLLSAFGLSQGMVTTSYKQLFHVQGMMLPVMVIAYSDNTYSSVIGSSLNEMTSLGVAEASTNNTPSVYPNPVVGNVVHIGIGALQQRLARVELIDLLGRIVTTNSIAKTSNNTIDLTLPSTLVSGQYFVRVIGESGKLLEMAKVQVAR